MTKFAAIDVAVLGEAIKQMDAGARTLDANCRSLRAQFERYGLDTAGLRKLAAIASWTRDQLPDLRRRHALATQLAKGHARVEVPEPYSVPVADAYLFQQATLRHDQAGLDLVASDLAKHLDDVDFLKAYADASPDGITAFQGLPAVDADKLSRLRLAERVKQPDCPASLQELAAYIDDPLHPRTYLLGFDTAGKGHVALSFGNPDTAPNTAVYVPGAGADGDGGDVDRSLALFEAANGKRPGSTASVYWLGYDAPGWNVPGPASQGFADTGAPRLASFVSALRASHTGRGHLTVVGHSYGSTLVGEACARFGMRPDDVVFIGSPGVTVDNASDLGIGAGHVWASRKKFDPIPELGLSPSPLHWFDTHSDRFGNDPTSRDFGGRTFDSGAGTSAANAHSQYWDAGPSLDNMAAIVTGRTKDVSAMPTEDRVGVLPNFADFAVDPLAGTEELAGSALQNAGHALGGHWGRPLEDAGDALHEVGQAQSTVVGAAADLVTGDPVGALNDLEDAGSSVIDSGLNVVRAVADAVLRQQP
ncbi:alpha/beta hydrolase [Streptomyces sp. CA2R106]|uniref:alpha/beta hydrolase n=1 Tax=Streptomyces sp. CA2R106 TaxID=3120153 RepID=UPI0030091C4C